MCNFQNEPDEVTFALHEIQELNDVDSDKLEKEKSWTIPVTCSLWAVDVGSAKLLREGVHALALVHDCRQMSSTRNQAESALSSSDAPTKNGEATGLPSFSFPCIPPAQGIMLKSSSWHCL